MYLLCFLICASAMLYGSMLYQNFEWMHAMILGYIALCLVGLQAFSRGDNA